MVLTTLARSLVPVLTVAALTVLTPRPAAAGDCTDGGPDEISALEGYARKPAKGGLVVDEICMEDALGNKRLAARFQKACDTILAREPGAFECVAWGARFHLTSLAGQDTFDRATAGWPTDPFVDNHQTLGIYHALADQRAVAVVVAAWRTALTDPRATAKKQARAWNMWRHSAAELLGNLGGATEKAFLTEQLAVTTAPGLKRAIKRAIKAIDKRAAAPAAR